MHQVSEWSLYKLMDDSFDAIFIHFSVSFGKAEYDRVHDLEDRLFVDPLKDQIFNLFVIHNDIHDLS